MTPTQAQADQIKRAMEIAWLMVNTTSAQSRDKWADALRTYLESIVPGFVFQQDWKILAESLMELHKTDKRTAEISAKYGLEAVIPERAVPVAMLYDLIPPSAAEWFADCPGIANSHRRGGWDACRNNVRQRLDDASLIPTAASSVAASEPSDGLTLELGKTYLDRSGRRITIIKKHGGVMYQYRGDNGISYLQHGFQFDGRPGYNESNEDLIAIVPAAPPLPDAGVPRPPLILKHLAEWEDKNGALCAITPKEWMALMKPIASLAVIESPRMARAAHTRPDAGWRNIATALLDANETFRDAVLHSRGALEEGTLNSDQTNAVLDQYDDDCQFAQRSLRVALAAPDQSLPDAGVLREALEALEIAGAMIAWNYFGECRAFGNTPVLVPSAVDKKLRAAITSLRSVTGTPPKVAELLTDDELRSLVRDPVTMEQFVAVQIAFAAKAGIVIKESGSV